MGTLIQGARNAVQTCMNVKMGEHVLIVTDRPRLEIGEALRKEAEFLRPGNTKLFVLEDFVSRPMKDLPQQIFKELPSANVTFWATDSMKGEVTSRMKFLRGPEIC